MVTVWLLDWPFPSCYGLRPGQGKLCGCQREKIKPGRWKGKEVRRCRDRNIQCESELRHALAGILPWHPPLEDQSPTLAWMEDEGQAPVTSSTGWTRRRRRPGWRGKWKDHGCRKGKKQAGEWIKRGRQARRGQEGQVVRSKWGPWKEGFSKAGAMDHDGSRHIPVKHKGHSLFLLKEDQVKVGEGTGGMDVRPKPHLANLFLPTGWVWRHRLCPLGLGENVSNGIREKLAK